MEKLFERMGMKKAPKYTPQITPAQQQELQELWEREAPQVPFLQLAGLMFGLDATSNAPVLQAPALLGVPEVTPPLMALLELYAAEVNLRLQTVTYAPPEEVFTDASTRSLEVWASGVGHAIHLDFQKYMTVLAGPPETEMTKQVMMVLAAFTPAGVGAPEMRDLPVEAVKAYREARNAFLEQWRIEPDSARREVLEEMANDLFVGFELAGAITASLNAKYGGSGGPDFEVFSAGGTVRREGRKIRPNELCPCGSGKKFKKCHGAPGAGPLPEGAG